MSQPPTRVPVSAPSGRDAASSIAYVLGGAVVIGAALLGRLPPGTLPRALVANRLWLLAVAGVLLLPLGLMAAGDLGRVRRRGYTPPSLRVQVARSLVYGAGLTAIQALAAMAWAPQLILLATRAGWRVAWLGVGVGLYAALAWWLAFKPREFFSTQLPGFRDAAWALRDSDDLLLGRTGAEDWKQGGGEQSWCLLPASGACCNVYVLGGIGSGKTHTVLKPLLEQALFKYPGPPTRPVLVGPPGRQKRLTAGDMRVGMLVLDATKGNLGAELLLPRARAAGRVDDVLVINPDGARPTGRTLTADEEALRARLVSYNPLSSGTPQALALRLVTALTVMTSQEPHSFYLKMQKEFATNAFSILHETLGAGNYTLKDLYDFICDPTFQATELEKAKTGNSLAYRWFTHQWARTEPKQRMQLVMGFRADLGQFVTPELEPTFCAKRPTFPGWRSILDQGRLVVFSMNRDEWGDMARALAIFLLMDFQDQVLARTTPRFKASGGNTDRMIMCFMDEAWAYLNPNLATFTAVSRESRCCTVALHQGLDQVPEAYRGTMTGNFRTHVILGVNDLLTMQTFSEIFGTHKVERTSRSQAQGFTGVELKLLSDAYTGRAGGASRSESVSVMEVEAPRFTPDEIQRTPKWHAVVQVFDGEEVRTPRLVSLLPGHENLLH